MSWLALSIIASIVLTVVLNVALRLFPDGADRLRDYTDRLAERPDDDRWDGTRRGGVRVIFPWKAMLIGSLLLTLVLNLWLYLR
jgi:hypothetical protein